MRLLSDKQGSSTSMTASKQLRCLLEETLQKERTSHVLETGTYRGEGSTTFVSECFPKDCPPKLFLTIEANWISWWAAKNNLRRFPFVTPLWGRTVGVKRALRFIANDDMLRNHTQYPDIYIDEISDPIRFYSDEISGGFGGEAGSVKQKLFWARDRIFHYAGDNLLEYHLGRIRTEKPLIALDSAGGIGFLEFSIVERAMREYSYLILLDDINHIKHFRSYAHVKQDPSFKIIGVDEQDGWLFAKHG
jgi:hypothetical protein